MDRTTKSNYLSLLFLLACMLNLSSCKTTKPSTSSTTSIYNEDLGAFRIALATYQAPTKEVTNVENNQITSPLKGTSNPPTSDMIAVDALLSRLAEKNSEFKSLPGY